MRELPDAEVRLARSATAVGHFIQLARLQWTTMVFGALCDIVWLLGLAVTPWVVGNAIDHGIIAQDGTAFVRWVGVLLGVSIVLAWAQTFRNRTGISNWNQAAFRSAQQLGHRLTTVGAAVQRRYTVGEVLAVQQDAWTLARLYFLVGGLTAALLSYGLVAVVVLQASVLLGIIVLVGVPLFGSVAALVARPLHHRQQEQREATGQMTTVAADAATGLRILRGIGGEAAFLQRFRDRSDTTRRTGLRLAAPISTLEGLQVLLGGALIITLTWVGGVLVQDGELAPGELVTFYGYATFLVTPVTLIATYLTTVVPAVIGAQRYVRLLGLPSLTDDVGRTPAPEAGSPLRDATTGIEIRPGTLVALTGPALRAPRLVVDRMARLDDAGLDGNEVRWGAESLRDIRLGDVRSRIMLVSNEALLFSGTLREVLDVSGRHDDSAIIAALNAAGALDLLQARPEGLDATVAAGGRDYSGGQRQRLGVARALLAAPEIMLLDDPTSAVDVHTEALMAQGISQYRAGLTTVLVTASPALLALADQVHVLDKDGAVLAAGAPADFEDQPAFSRTRAGQ